MNAPRRPPAVLFVAALAIAARLLLVTAMPQAAHSQGAAPGVISPLVTAPVSPLLLAQPPPEQDSWAVVEDGSGLYHVRVPEGWYASFLRRGGNIANYDDHSTDQRPDNAIWIDVGLGELSFPQTFAQYVARWKEIESVQNEAASFPTPIPLTPSQPVTLGSYTGVSEIDAVAVGDGQRQLEQSILLLVERHWVARIRIHPLSSPDYAQALRILTTLEFAPRCAEDADPGAGSEAELRTTLEILVAHELEARQAENWPALESLMHSKTDPRWLERQRGLLGPKWTAIDLTRIQRSGDWALAAAIETQVNEEGAPAQFYTIRTFRQEDTGCWALASPDRRAWIATGDQGQIYSSALNFGLLSITFPPFDEPYVRAAGPRAGVMLPHMAADFGLIPGRNGGYFVRLYSFAGADDPLGSENSWLSTISSPLAPGFSLDLAQSPEEYLVAYLIDTLGHELLKDEFGERAQEPARLALAHAAVQWEVEQTVGRDSSANLRSQVTGARTPLAVLLDPTTVNVTATSTAERGLFLRFAVAQYGRESIAPYLRAVFNASSAEKLIRQAFEQEPEEIERQWQEWLD